MGNRASHTVTEDEDTATSDSADDGGTKPSPSVHHRITDSDTPSDIQHHNTDTAASTQSVTDAPSNTDCHTYTQSVQKDNTSTDPPSDTQHDNTSTVTTSDKQHHNADTPRLYELASLQRQGQWPILYSPLYNIYFMGLERVVPFDNKRWKRVYRYLIEGGMLKGIESTVPSHEASPSELSVAHSHQYLRRLNRPYHVSKILQLPSLAIVPRSTVHRRMLKPLRYQTGGTIMAGKLAKEQGWAINIGGGFHHCSSDEGGGFCAYADITLSVKFMFQYLEGISKVMIVDFDAHQGNGHERDFMNDDRVYILDMYNKWIYPNDREAKRAIKRSVEFDKHTKDREYLDSAQMELPKALEEFAADIVVYNAGTDVLIGDHLGEMDITPNGIIERDRLVFEEVRRRNIPILMVTSGGFQRTNARVIADSILNLQRQGLIQSPEDDAHLTSELRSQGVSLEQSLQDNSKCVDL